MSNRILVLRSYCREEDFILFEEAGEDNNGNDSIKENDNERHMQSAWHEVVTRTPLYCNMFLAAEDIPVDNDATSLADASSSLPSSSSSPSNWRREQLQLDNDRSLIKLLDKSLHPPCSAAEERGIDNLLVFPGLDNMLDTSNYVFGVSDCRMLVTLPLPSSPSSSPSYTSNTPSTMILNVDIEPTHFYIPKNGDGVGAENGLPPIIKLHLTLGLDSAKQRFARYWERQQHREEHHQNSLASEGNTDSAFDKSNLENGSDKDKSRSHVSSTAGRNAAPTLCSTKSGPSSWFDIASPPRHLLSIPQGTGDDEAVLRKLETSLQQELSYIYRILAVMACIALLLVAMFIWTALLMPSRNEKKNQGKNIPSSTTMTPPAPPIDGLSVQAVRSTKEIQRSDQVATTSSVASLSPISLDPNLKANAGDGSNNIRCLNASAAAADRKKEHDVISTNPSTPCLTSTTASKTCDEYDETTPAAGATCVHENASTIAAHTDTLCLSMTAMDIPNRNSPTSTTPCESQGIAPSQSIVVGPCQAIRHDISEKQCHDHQLLSSEDESKTKTVDNNNNIARKCIKPTHGKLKNEFSLRSGKNLTMRMTNNSNAAVSSPPRPLSSPAKELSVRFASSPPRKINHTGPVATNSSVGSLSPITLDTPLKAATAARMEATYKTPPVQKCFQSDYSKLEAQFSARLGEKIGARSTTNKGNTTTEREGKKTPVLRPVEKITTSSNRKSSNKEVLMLCSSLSHHRHVLRNQQLAELVLRVNGIPYSTLDGADPINKERRNQLFNLSGFRGKYPQFFLVEKSDDSTKISFWGDWETFDSANNDSGTLTKNLGICSASVGEKGSVSIDARPTSNTSFRSGTTFLEDYWGGR